MPANRFGHATLTAPQLKMIPEVIEIAVVLGVNALWLQDPKRTPGFIAMALIAISARQGLPGDGFDGEWLVSPRSLALLASHSEKIHSASNVESFNGYIESSNRPGLSRYPMTSFKNRAAIAPSTKR